MTPRAIDTNGLSAANSLKNGLPGKNQITDTSKPKNLCAVCDNPNTGHVSITPNTNAALHGTSSSISHGELCLSAYAGGRIGHDQCALV